MRQHRFHAEEDQRRKDNIIVDELLSKLSAMPNGEKLIADILARLLPGKQRSGSKSIIKTATG